MELLKTLDKDILYTLVNEYNLPGRMLGDIFEEMLNNDIKIETVDLLILINMAIQKQPHTDHHFVSVIYKYAKVGKIPGFDIKKLLECNLGMQRQHWVNLLLLGK